MNFLLVVWLCMPSFLMVVFSLPSLALGLLATSVVTMLSTLLLNLNRRLRFEKLYLAFLAAAVVSILLSHYLAQQPFSSKQGSSLAGLVVLAFGASTFMHYYFSRGAISISTGVKRTYLFLVAIGLISIVLPIRVGPYSLLNQPVFPFIEPSHYTLAYAQIASISLPFLKRNGRLLLVLTSFLLALSLPNTTMLAIAFLLLLVTASVRLLLLMPMTLVPVIMFITTSAPDVLIYFTDRLTSDGAANLSRVVYIQGWESLVSAISTTNGLGIGFQNLGNEPPGEATAIISTLTNDSTLNRADGGFLFAKIGGEFGVIGVIAALSLLVLAILSGIRLRRELKSRLNTENALALIPLCSTYIVIVEMLIRGVSYFSPTFLIVIYFMPKALHILRNKTPSMFGSSKRESK